MPATIARTGGANTLVVIGEPAKFENLTMLGPLLDRNARIGAYAQSIGFKVGWIFNNEGLSGGIPPRCERGVGVEHLLHLPVRC